MLRAMRKPPRTRTKAEAAPIAAQKIGDHGPDSAVWIESAAGATVTEGADSTLADLFGSTVTDPDFAANGPARAEFDAALVEPASSSRVGVAGFVLMATVFVPEARAGALAPLVA